MLVIASRLRGRGIGRALVDAAEARLLERGCRLIEVTSNKKLAGAHGFCQRPGYERTSHRFAKQVGEFTAVRADGFHRGAIDGLGALFSFRRRA